MTSIVEGCINSPAAASVLEVLSRRNNVEIEVVGRGCSCSPRHLLMLVYMLTCNDSISIHITGDEDNVQSVTEVVKSYMDVKE